MTHGRKLGRAAIPSLAVISSILAACHGSVVAESSAAGGQTGSGGQGGSSSTVAPAGGGGNGGVGASSAGGSGGVGGAPEECVPACDKSHFCILGQCTAVQTLSVEASRGISKDAASAYEYGTLSGCVRLANADTVEKLLAEEGPCKVAIFAPPGDSGALAKLGTLTAEAPSIGLLTLLPSDTLPCLAANLSPETDLTAEFLETEGILFKGTGGPAIPAFSVQVPPAPTLSMSVPSLLVRGKPYEIKWSTSGPPPTVFVAALDQESSIQCTPESGQALTIPGSLTALLSATSDFAVVTTITSTPEQTVDLSLTARVVGRSSRFQMALVDYQP